jgi:competence protein ComEA
MRSRSPSPEHAEAVSRRLATLSAELAAVRGDPPSAHEHTRVRAGRLDPVAAETRFEPAVIPTPGRHASRRLVDRVALSPAPLAVGAGAVAVAIGIAAWLVVRSQAAPVPVPDAVPEAMPAAEPLVEAPDAGATAAAAAPDAELTVDVAGRVRRPGIAVLPAGSRVVDALKAAGGARRGVDLTGLNLARQLVDGEQILVGLPAPSGVAASVGAPDSSPAGPLVNLNTADETTLETLPGVGPVTAAAIVAWRTEHGGFTAVEELLEVDGIGDATLAEIAPHVTI